MISGRYEYHRFLIEAKLMIKLLSDNRLVNSPEVIEDLDIVFPISG